MLICPSQVPNGYNFHSRRWYAHARPHVSEESPSTISPNPSEVIVMEPKENSEITPPCPPKSVIVRGVGGVPNFVVEQWWQEE
jgi:hypothetical protein